MRVWVITCVDSRFQGRKTTIYGIYKHKDVATRTCDLLNTSIKELVYYYVHEIEVVE